MLKEGDKAPDFVLETINAGKRTDVPARLSLKDFRDKTLVLYFYPKDSTPGCTREAEAFSAAQRAIEMAGGAVVGVSRDSVKSHCSFRDKFALTIPLASDPDLRVHKAYGAWGDKVMYGRKMEGCIRSTFLIKNGRIARVFPSVKVDGHAEAVLQAMGELAHGPSSRSFIRAREIAGAAKTAVKAAVAKVVKKAATKRKTSAKKTAKTTSKKKRK